MIDIPAAINLACVWEASAAKPGNVNRMSDFADTHLIDFLNSAVVIGRVIDQRLRWLQRDKSVGSQHTGPAQPGASEADGGFAQTVFECIQQTGLISRSNTNLGIVLLLVPLAHAAAQIQASSAIAPTAKKMTSGEAPIGDNPYNQVLESAGWRQQVTRLIATADAKQTVILYQAIGMAMAGGLGTVAEADVNAQQSLTEQDTVSHVMGLAAGRDRIAAEYHSGFEITFEFTAPQLRNFLRAGYPVQWSIVVVYLQLLAKYPDTLIQRKLGTRFAEAISVQAGQIAAECCPQGVPLPWNEFQAKAESIQERLAEFDFYLRSDGNRRNPGTTADLIAAGLLVSLLLGDIQFPVVW